MRGRILILLVLVILVVAIIGVAVLMMGGGESDPGYIEVTADDGSGTIIQMTYTPVPAEGEGGGAAGEPAESTPTPEEMIEIVIALQELPRGFELTENTIRGESAAVGLRLWPKSSIPVNSYSTLEELDGLIVRTDIPRESPILATQLAQNLTGLSRTGSDAALLLPRGYVAVSMPLDPFGIGQVAYGLQPGDRVDVIMSFLFIEVDETFQARQPNKISIITRDEDGNLLFSDPLPGRPEASTLSSLGVLVVPQEQQRPRLVTQRTVEGAMVIHVGYFPEDGQIIGIISPTPYDTPTVTPIPEGAEGQQQQQPENPTATVTPFQPIIVTLGVEPQDALVLTYALDSKVPIVYALRSATDVGSVPTTPVTLQYLIENYNIPLPPALPFAIEPPITSVRNFDLSSYNDLVVEQLGVNN